MLSDIIMTYFNTSYPKSIFRQYETIHAKIESCKFKVDWSTMRIMYIVISDIGYSDTQI